MNVFRPAFLEFLQEFGMLEDVFEFQDEALKNVDMGEEKFPHEPLK